MTVRFPDVGPTPGLGVGLDLPWGAASGFVRSADGTDHITERVRRFLTATPQHGQPWSHAFFSLQPRDRSVPRIAAYRGAWDDLMGCVPVGASRALHSTALDLGAAREKQRGPLLSLINGLIERHDLRWVNEDLGLWSLGDKPLPYPLPPYLTSDGLRAAVRNVHECQQALAVPLVVEFPGFARGVSLPIGDLDAYDFFCSLAQQTEAPCTLDVGHLLSWRWLKGHRGEALFGALERLPLRHCFEIHLSGCEVIDNAFYDRHHGQLLDEQFELLRRLLPRCPNLRAITYEDPVITSSGALAQTCAPSLARLARLVADWQPMGAALVARQPPPSAARSDVGASPRLERLEALFEGLVWDEGIRSAFLSAGELSGANAQEIGWLCTIDATELRSLADLSARHLLTRGHAGTGTLERCFPDAFSAWRANHPGDHDLLDLARRFCAHDGSRVREGMCVQPGTTLEEAFADFAAHEGLASRSSLQLALARAIGRALLMSDAPMFAIPSMFRRCPGGIFAVVAATPPHLVAVLGSRVVEGPITELLDTLLTGVSVTQAARHHRIAPRLAAAAAARLIEMGLLNGPDSG